MLVLETLRVWPHRMALENLNSKHGLGRLTKSHRGKSHRFQTAILDFKMHFHQKTTLQAFCLIQLTVTQQWEEGCPSWPLWGGCHGRLPGGGDAKLHPGGFEETPAEPAQAGYGCLLEDNFVRKFCLYTWGGGDAIGNSITLTQIPNQVTLYQYIPTHLGRETKLRRLLPVLFEKLGVRFPRVCILYSFSTCCVDILTHGPTLLTVRFLSSLWTSFFCCRCSFPSQIPSKKSRDNI